MDKRTEFTLPQKSDKGCGMNIEYVPHIEGQFTQQVVEQTEKARTPQLVEQIQKSMLWNQAVSP